jgi:flagellar basal-body rod modification protein FlgD
MAIDYTTSIPPTVNQQTQAQATQSKTMVDYNSFLKLLIAQMKNQDPTQPMDSTQYVAQLATFSQVEQSVQTNTKLDSILQSSALSQAESVIGRNITSADGKTSGTVKEVQLSSTGLVAILGDGTQVPIATGVTISPAS